MNTVEYESYQLDLICTEYMQKGFTIAKQAKLQKIAFQFDAMAYREFEGKRQIVLIELVHAGRADRLSEKRTQAFERLAKVYPSVLVDFRYIDTNETPWISFSKARPQSISSDLLDQCIKRRLPKPDNTSALSINKQFLELWGLHAMTIRSYAGIWLSKDVTTKGILDIYNELLQSGYLRPPEDLVRGLKLDLFEINDLVQGAIQGASVEKGDVREINGHVLSIRRQIRKDLNMDMDKKDAS
jgi:hypothetical protein